MNTRRLVPLLAAALALLLLAAVVAVFVTRGGSTRTIRAEFAEAPGLFVGNHVDVLGVPVGNVTSVQGTAGHAMVTMTVKSNVKLPATVGAVIMAPQVVADRFVQLTPAYSSGPTMPAGGTIPVSRTDVPESVNNVIGTLNTLAQQLGPNGVNANGALTSLLSNLANQLRGNGPEINKAVTSFASALGAVAQDSPQIRTLLENLASLTTALANNDNTYKAFAGNLASVSTYLGNDSSNIGKALQSLQQFFATLTTFVADNATNLHTGLINFDRFAQVLSEQQQNLARAFDLTPLTLQNLNNAINTSAPGGPALRARYDPQANSAGLFNTVCGSFTLRFLVVLATGTQTNPLTRATSQDTVCAVGNAINGLTPPPRARRPGPTSA